MKVPLHVVHARRERLGQLLEQHRYLPVKELCRLLEVSEATARRDLAALVHEKKITRTYGGALHEFNDRFPSFRDRQRQGTRAKAKISRLAIAYFKPNQTYFFDSGTTIYALAQVFREQPVTPVTIVTSNLPVCEMLASIPGVQAFLVAGQLLHLQSTLLGETAQKSLEFWNFDMAFLSAEAMDAQGLWNSQEAIVEQQKVVLQRSGQTIFCIDGSKVNRSAPHFLLPWERVDVLLTDAPDEKLRHAGIVLTEDQRAIPAVARVASSEPVPQMENFARESEEGEMPVHFL